MIINGAEAKKFSFLVVRTLGWVIYSLGNCANMFTLNGIQGMYKLINVFLNKIKEGILLNKRGTNNNCHKVDSVNNYK